MNHYYHKKENISECNLYHNSEIFYKFHYNYDIGEYHTPQDREDKCNFNILN